MTNLVIVALDHASGAQALQLVDKLDPSTCRLKVGKEMFTREGPDFVRQLVKRGFDVFLDLKFHDIPNTVAGAVRAAAELGVWMVNVHASGGKRMMQAAREALEPFGEKRPLLIGVTVLTSTADQELSELGLAPDAKQQVLRLANLAKDSGLDGVVCSAQEATELKAALGAEFQLVTPGIRLAGAVADDQRRVMTPVAARDAGADHLVIGRPITGSDDPAQTVNLINQQLAQ